MNLPVTTSFIFNPNVVDKVESALKKGKRATTTHKYLPGENYREHLLALSFPLQKIYLIMRSGGVSATGSENYKPALQIHFAVATVIQLAITFI